MTSNLVRHCLNGSWEQRGNTAQERAISLMVFDYPGSLYKATGSVANNCRRVFWFHWYNCPDREGNVLCCLNQVPFSMQ